MGVAAKPATNAATAGRPHRPAAATFLARPTSLMAPRACDCGATAGLSGHCAACDRASLSARRGGGAAADIVSFAAAPAPAGAAAPGPESSLIRQTSPVRVQTEMRVSSPSDPAEQEAQSVGKTIARMPDPDAKPPRVEAGASGVAQRRESGGEADPSVLTELRASSSGGSALPADVRSFMEPRFRADFSGVRIHTDARAARLSAALGARAFTIGRDVYFARGQFRVDSPDGWELIAHELTHTIQQGGVRRPPPAQPAAAPSPPTPRTQAPAPAPGAAPAARGAPAAAVPPAPIVKPPPAAVATGPVAKPAAPGAGRLAPLPRGTRQDEAEAGPAPLPIRPRAPVAAAAPPPPPAPPPRPRPPAGALASAPAPAPPIRPPSPAPAARTADPISAAVVAHASAPTRPTVPTPMNEAARPAVAEPAAAPGATHATAPARVPEPAHAAARGKPPSAPRAAEAVRPGRPYAIAERAPASLQRLGVSDALSYFADKANLIPGFRMLTIILGVNPISMAPVDRSPANILRALIEFLPGGVLITQALDNAGVFDKVGAWVSEQIATLALTGAALKQAALDFLHSLSWTDIFDLGGVWERAKRIFTEPIDRIIAFAKNLVQGILKFIKDAILMPLAKLAEGTRGWDLLIGVLGRNPITGDAVPRTPEVLIGGFLKLIGQDEIWQNMQKANAIQRAWAWFQGALNTVVAFVSQIPDLFSAAFKSLTIEDVVLVSGAFQKVASVFGGFVEKFIDWAGTAIWNLLEIVFEVVSPGALTYVKKTAEALHDILKNPLPFVLNLVKAAKLGLQNFADHIGTHLKTGLIEWLTGAIPDVYIPKAFSLIEIGRFALSVLGLTWTHIRGKIVKALGPAGETIMSGLEKVFAVITALINGGVGAAWELIKEQLTNLKDMVVGELIGFIKETIVEKAIPQLLAMFVPGAGFIGAILSIYNTIKSFMEQLAKVAAAIKAFVDSIVAIAKGQIEGAANKVESALASVIPVAIGMLAGFLKLGGIPAKIKGVIDKIRAPVDKALDTAIAWVIAKAKALFASLFGGKDKDGGKAPPKGQIESFEEPFDMAGAGHDASVEVVGEKPLLTMASNGKASLADLISKVLNSDDPKVKAKLTDPGLRNTLTSIKQQADTLNKFMWDNMEQLYPQNESYNKATVQMVSTARGSIIQELRALGQEHSIKSFSDLGHPSKYVLDDKIRPELQGQIRETFYNVSWDSGAAGYKTTQMKDLRLKAQEKRPSIAALPPSERDNWYWSEDRSGTVGPPAIVNINDKNGSPELDHVEPLGVRWLSTGKPKPGNDTVQGDRDKDYLDNVNLQVLAKWMNLQKGGDKFEPKVGPNFRGPDE